MTSLGEAYGGARGATPRRLYAGVALFLAGAALVGVGIVVAGTDFLLSRGYTLGEAREIAGIVGGVGVPAVFLGILSVLPSSRRNRAAAVIGAFVCLLGVAMFRYAYPCRWIGANCGVATDLTLPTVGVYFLGAITTFWCLFVGVATFKTRNDPGGTARLDVIRKGETRIVEVDRSRGLGGIGFFGATPDGEVETQTNDGTGTRSHPAAPDPTPSGAATTGAVGGSTVSDGGATTRDVRSPPDGGAEVVRNDDGGGTEPDRYCGNCEQFDYVRTDAGIQPYCGLHDELMDDMDACSEWTPNNR
jgi:MFS family permease